MNEHMVQPREGEAVVFIGAVCYNMLIKGTARFYISNKRE